MTYLSIGVLLVAIAFLMISVGVAIFLYRMTDTLNKAGDAIQEVDIELSGVTKEVEGTLVAANGVMDDVTYKVEKLNPIFTSIDQLGEANRIQTVMIEEQLKAYKPSEQDLNKYVQAVQWGEVASRLYRKWKVNKM